MNFQNVSNRATSCPGPREGGTKLLFRSKNILCFGPSFHIWISLIVHFCDLPSVCIERQELIVLLISFPVNSAARQGGSSNKTHFSSFCRRPRISTSARSFFNDCLAASFAQPWFWIFCSNSHHCWIFAQPWFWIFARTLIIVVFLPNNNSDLESLLETAVAD